MPPVVGWAAVAAAIAGPLLAYLGAVRKLSGRIETSTAEELWEQNRLIKEDYRSQLGDCRSELAKARNDLAETRNELAGARNETAKARNELADARHEVAGLKNQVAELMEGRHG